MKHLENKKTSPEIRATKNYPKYKLPSLLNYNYNQVFITILFEGSTFTALEKHREQYGYCQYKGKNVN